VYRGGNFYIPGFLILRFLNPLQRSRAKCLSADEGGKLSERSEFLTPPQSNTSRGEPKAKLLGGFSLVR